MIEILLYGVIGDDWDGLDAATIVPLIADSTDDLSVRINSPGGYVMEGLAIFNALDRAQAAGRKVTVHIDGLAASMGSVIAMAGNECIMANNALMMIHNPWNVAIGDAAELRRSADGLDKIRDQMIKIYQRRSSLSAEELTAMLDAETWLTPEEALSHGLITSVAELASSSAALNIKPFGFAKAPDHPILVQSMAASIQSVRMGGAKTGISKALAAILQSKETNMVPTKPGGQEPADNNATDATGAASTQSVEEATAKAREEGAAAATARINGIIALCDKHGMTGEFKATLTADSKVSIDDARAKILDKLAEQSDTQAVGGNASIVVGTDERTKFAEGASNWILQRAGVSALVQKAAADRGQKLNINPGEFRGLTMVDIARMSLAMMGVTAKSHQHKDIIGAAFTARNSITQSTSDFAVLLENVLHKVLQASYATAPNTWKRICGTGSVSDFRAHHRYARGSFGTLDSLNELGEFKQKAIPDGAKESITASTVGNIIGISRHALVNDDLSAFSDLAVDLGIAANDTIEEAVYAFLAANAASADGNAFFSAEHGNLLTGGGAPTVEQVDKVRQAMASQKDVSGNRFLSVVPSILLCPLNLGGTARVTNKSEYDPDTAGKLQRHNISYGVFKDIVDTPRLTGSAWFAFADPTVAPAIEVAFLNGVEEPDIEEKDGWTQDGSQWRVRHDFGVGGPNWRMAVKNPGA